MKRKSQMEEFIDEAVGTVLMYLDEGEDGYEWKIQALDRYTFLIELFLDKNYAKFLVIHEKITSVGLEEMEGFDETFLRRFASALYDEID